MRSRFLVAVAVLVAAAYGLYLRSDAYRNGNRLFYSDRRPTRAGRVVGRALSSVYGSGLGPSFLVSLETVGRRSGRRQAIPMVLADHAGERYLVSMFGERSPWVHNVRAAGGRAAIRHGRRREVRLVELPPESRAPVLMSYLGRAVGARPHIPVDPNGPIEAFEGIARSYPVFRIDAGSSAGPT